MTPRPRRPGAQPPTATRITLRGLLVARAALMVCALGVLGMDLILSNQSPIAWRPGPTDALTYLAIMLAWLATTAIEYRRLQQPGELHALWPGGHLLVDVLAITILLALSGGATNPFTLLYVVPITLAILVSARWTWIIAGASLVGFAALFLAESSAHHGGHTGHFEGHLRGMWLAFAITGPLVAFTVHRIAIRIEHERAELDELRERALVDRHLAQIGTLAAGAAHELGTPLATLNVLAGELRHMEANQVAEAADLISAQIKRCKQIIQRMATPEPRATAGSDLEAWQLTELAAELRDETGEIDVDDSDRTLVQVPLGAVSQIVRELLANARSASTTPPRVRIAREGDDAVIEVVDAGPGMSPDVARAAFDPFFSTKREGQGMGLGLYIARAQARLLGGTVDLANAKDRGTRATLRFPIQQSETA